MLMRVLSKGRTAVGLAVIAGITAVALPASAGVTARAVAPAGEVSTHGVVLGTAVAYVREPDGTVRQYR
jgi:hypothetical protein